MSEPNSINDSNTKFIVPIKLSDKTMKLSDDVKNELKSIVNKMKDLYNLKYEVTLNLYIYPIIDCATKTGYKRNSCYI